MTYLKRTNHTGKKSLKVTLSVLALLAVLFTIHLVFPSFYARIFTPVASLVWKGGSSTTGFFGRMWAIASSKSSLISENADLRREIESRDAKALLLSTLQKENENLKSMLGRASSTKDVLAAVLSRPPVTPYDTLIIDIGEKDGVLVGDKVYVEGTTLIGDVSEVYGSTAKVALFSTPGRETSVLVGDDYVEAQAVGHGSGNFVISLPSEIGSKEGDVIVLPQVRTHIFGVVGQVDVDSTHSIETIYFKAPFNMHQLRFVEVAISQ